MVDLDAEIVGNFTKVFLMDGYDNPKPIPGFHYEMWELCFTGGSKVGIAAPRGFAKSSAISFAWLLCCVLFRRYSFVLLVSDTEGQASLFLGDIKAALQENEKLRHHFMVDSFKKESETDIIVRFKDGELFRIIAKGSEQKVRGLKWRGRRPDLILGDDLENDEIVMNPDRRGKFLKWFKNALLPVGSDDCDVRVVGTILHLASMLNNLMDNPEWSTLKFKAHGPGFTELLWPEKFPVERLEKIRNDYIHDGNIEGYSQEYLNEPLPDGETYFRKCDFIEMEENVDFDRLAYFAAADFAISESERADYTVIMVAGVDERGFIHIVDARRGRMDSKEIIDELISVQRRYDPVIFTFETEKIDKAIGPFLNDEMRRTGVYLNINKITPSKSKTTRGRSMQGKMKAGSVRFDTSADWYDDMVSELMTIGPSGPRGKHDDFFDAFSYIGLTIDKYFEGQTQEEVIESEYEEYEEEYEEEGVSWATGY